MRGSGKAPTKRGMRGKRGATRGPAKRRRAAHQIAKDSKLKADPSDRVPPKNVRRQLHEHACEAWSVFGTYWGYKQVRGKWTKQLALICLVETKSAPKDIPRGRCVRERVRWKERKCGHWLMTDVIQDTPGVELQRGILGPGDGVRSANSIATLGAVIDHPEFGRCVTTAGHFFGGPRGVGQRALAESGGAGFEVTVKRCRQQQAADYAVLQPAAGPDCDNLFQDRVRIGPLFVPTAGDVGKRVFVLSSAGPIPTTCRGIHARLRTAVGTFEEVILADPVTRLGMSGAALVDSQARLWGFLVGTIGRHSVFMPATLPLTAERSELV